jgi:dipeptidyl-peptidase-4
LPAFAYDGDLLVYRDDIPSNTRRVCKISLAAQAGTEEKFVTPAGAQVLSVLSHGDSGILFSSVLDSPCVSLHHANWNGECTALMNTDDGGHHLCQSASSADPGAAVIVLASSSLMSCETEFRIVVKQRVCGCITNNQISPSLASPPVVPKPLLHKLTPANLSSVLLFPNSHVLGSRRLPLIMCPYGGPHHAKAIAHGRSHALAQCLPCTQPDIASAAHAAFAGTSLTWVSPSLSQMGGELLDEGPYGTELCTTTSRLRH